MRIRRAIGLGIALIVVRLFAPHVWHGIDGTFTALFDTVQSALSASATVIGSISTR